MILSTPYYHPLYMDLKSLINSFSGGWKITTDDGQYFAASNGKRMIQINCEIAEEAYLGIREDGGTRTAFNGRVYNIDDFRKIMSLVM